MDEGHREVGPMMRALRYRFLAASLILLAASFASAQQPQSDPLNIAPDLSPSDSANAPNTGMPARAGTSISTEQLIRILRSNPDTMVEAKSLLGTGAQDEADATAEPGNPTDDQLYTLLEQSPEARARLTSALLARGYIDERQAASLRDRTAADQDEQSPSPNPYPDPSLDPFSPGTGSVDSSRQSRLSPSALDDTAAPILSQRRMREAPRDARREASPAKDAPNITDEPAALRRPTPYNLRSLRELYTQVPEAREHLKRFGSELFEHRAQLPQRQLMDAPLGPDYVLGVGDELSIAIWGGISQNLARVIDREGRVSLPEVGPVPVAGLTLGNAEERVRQLLQSQFRNAQVSLTVARLRTLQIYVVGEVQRPGACQVSSLASPVAALLAAGGPTARGSLRLMRLVRADKIIGEIDLYDFLLHGVHAGQSRIEAGDTLLVPPAGPQVAVYGAVKRPAIYELKDEKTLDAVLADAGGLTVAAELGQINVERVLPNLGRKEVNFGSATETTESLQVRLATFEVKDGDRIRIGVVPPSSDRVVYLQGHVVRPGKVGYRDGMLLTDVLRTYRDLLPEPAQIGEIVRLVPPDLHPETIEFSIPDQLLGNSPLALQPFDTVRAFGRYEQDAPMVTVRGEVKRPGAYPLFEGMTAAQLVRTAGGFKRDALLDNADLMSYSVLDGSRVSVERKVVPIGEAVLHNQPAADSVLKPGDVLTIHQLTGWNDMGASINLDGEVAHPGSYGYREGEHLSDILRRAGGLLATAYPEGAVLTRPEVAKLEERNRDELIRQIQAGSAAARLSPGIAGADQTAALQLIQQQQEQVLSDLRKQPALGRLVIHINADIASWAGTAADIEVRNGDVLRIPKRPGFVLVSGQVYNASAITFQPGKSAAWYLQHAGGATSIANRKEIFVIRANGSVVGRRSGGWYGGDVLSTRLEPGDTIVVPQKIIGASLFWRNVLSSAQVAASLAIAAAVAGL